MFNNGYNMIIMIMLLYAEHSSVAVASRAAFCSLAVKCLYSMLAACCLQSQ